MADEPPNGNGNGRHRIKFDPTINLGHILTACAFLVATVAAWRDLDSRANKNAEEIRRVEGTMEKSLGKAELDLSRRIIEGRQHVDQTQVRTADDIRDMKLMLRDGFREIDQKLDRKVDKPGR